MKTTNTFLSLLRHALSTVGGILIVSPEPQTKTIGTILVALGTLWGAVDEHKAENPGGGLKLPGSGSGTSLLILCALLGLGIGSTLFSGCATTAAAPSAKQTQLTAAVLNLAGTSVAPILQKNPAYIPVAQAVVDGLDTLTTGTFDAAKIGSWITQLAVRKGWDAAQTIYAQTITTAAWSIYTTSSGQSSAQIADPNVQTWLKAFRAGLGNAITIAQALNAPSAK